VTPAVSTQIAELSRRLTIPYWQERRDGDRIVLIAGSRGTVKSAPDALRLTLRPKASTAVQGVKQQLIDAGLLTEGRVGSIDFSVHRQSWLLCFIFLVRAKILLIEKGIVLAA